MNAKKLLPPLPLAPVDVRPGERWLAADMGRNDTPVRGGMLDGNGLGDIVETYMERVTGDRVFACFGRQFPVLVRTLSFTEASPVTVSPSDEVAVSRYDALGRRKLWYVLSAGENARLYLGLQAASDAGALYGEVGRSGSLLGMLNTVRPLVGELYCIPAGVLHAAQDVTLVEAGPSSDLDFQVDTDPDDLSEALDFIRYEADDLEAFRIEPASDGLVFDGPEFLARLLPVDAALKVLSSGGEYFSLCVGLGGEVSVQFPDAASPSQREYVLPEGECLLVPAEQGEFILSPRRRSSRVLLVNGQGETSDSYLS